ncbi:tail fiber assembly protein [Morganella morganii]|uniref:tail fiber assembly protein n=1 Tax=Morganella morganii TaxID=582 RepID=UPI00298E4669|nr:tail fiber assembly protein [Morganella morganii]MDW7796076.1 tail fiber assembly protein [Morganella morganii]
MKYYSNETNGFYDSEINGDDIPQDVVEITDETWMELLSGQEEGKVISADENGYPVLIDPPPLSHERHVAMAESQKQALIAEASQKTQLWQTQLMLGIITDEDKASLKEWMLYVQEVQAVDPSLGAAVVWPTPPASPAR